VEGAFTGRFLGRLDRHLVWHPAGVERFAVSDRHLAGDPHQLVRGRDRHRPGRHVRGQGLWRPRKLEPERAQAFERARHEREFIDRWGRFEPRGSLTRLRYGRGVLDLPLKWYPDQSLGMLRRLVTDLVV